MPFQLIHTSSPHLLDAVASGYGTVARSEGMPAMLYTQLPALSSLKEVAGASSQSIIQFSYRILTACGQAWHVLSCVQSAGADYSGRACHTAHHLIFSEQEAAALLSHPLRPTPAGITLALFREGFWVKQWQGPPRMLNSSPCISPEKQPDATTQTTWKQYTGHKANAKAFYTPPYNKECLVVVPQNMQVTEVLSLFHESDWLSHTRGWGMSYTTAADETDSFSDTLRIVVPQDSPLVQRASRTRYPVLFISSTLELPVVPPPSAVQVPQSSQHPVGMMRALARNTTHYHYVEDPDWAVFDIPQPWSTCKKAILCGSVGLLCGTSLLIWAGMRLSAPRTAASPNVLAEAPILPLEQSPLIRFKNLVAAPYIHDITSQAMQDFTLLKGQGAEETRLAECAVIFKSADAEGTHHASGIKRLCECARLLGIDEYELVLLYIRHATYDRSSAEWHSQFEAEDAEEWLRLQMAEPVLAQVFEVPELKGYAPRAGSETVREEPTLLATATTPEECAEEVTRPASEPARISLIPHPARCGESLPEPLAQLLTQLPQTISTGRYIVASMKQGDSIGPARTLELSEDGYRLHIAATENNGEYKLTPSHKDGKPSPLPAITVRIHGDQLRTVRADNEQALVSFPVPQQERIYTNIILAPEFGIPLPSNQGIKLPESSRLNFNISAESLELVTAGKKPKLRLAEAIKTKGYPWGQDSKQTEQIRFLITLPVLNAHNSVEVTQNANSRYSCLKTSISKETEMQTTLRCVIEHKPALPRRLEAVFNNIANNPCCGAPHIQANAPSLADLYYITTALGDNKIKTSARKKLHTAYFQLMSHKQFNAEIRKILPELQNILLTPEEATGKSFRARKLRNDISSQLDKPTVQQAIRLGLTQLLRRSLIAAYEQEKHEFETDSSERPALMLQHISQGEHGELLWHFQLQTTR